MPDAGRLTPADAFADDRWASGKQTSLEAMSPPLRKDESACKSGRPCEGPWGSGPSLPIARRAVRQPSSGKKEQKLLRSTGALSIRVFPCPRLLVFCDVV